MCLEMFFHLFYDVFGFVVIPHVKIYLHVLDFIGMTACRAEFPLLEPVYVRKLRAYRAADDHVHYYVVIACRIIKTYLKTIYFCINLINSFCLNNPWQNLSPEVKRNSYIGISSHRDVIMENIQVIGIRGLPLIHKGDNIASMICEHVKVQDGDILSIASTVYSKAMGYTGKLSDISPTEHALRLAKLNGEDPRFVQAVLDASADIIMETPFILSELGFGHIGVRAGVDQSNIEDDMVIFLPPDPMKSAEELRDSIRQVSGKNVGVIITDTCGRSFRRGQTGNAIGWSGFTAIRDFRGDTDLFGHVLKITEEAVVDEIAGFANFVMGESNNGVPAVVFRNCPKWTGHNDLFFSRDEDITRRALKNEWHESQ